MRYSIQFSWGAAIPKTVDKAFDRPLSDFFLDMFQTCLSCKLNLHFAPYGILCVEIATHIPSRLPAHCQPLGMVWLTQAAAAGALLG